MTIVRYISLLLLAADASSFSLTPSSRRTIAATHHPAASSSRKKPFAFSLEQTTDASSEDDSNKDENESELASENGDLADDEAIMTTSTVRIDDGGSNLTDRFKYKVNALMGVFDPPEGTDNENESGHILNAMLNFPVSYSFNVVGRTLGDEIKTNDFVDQVKAAVLDSTGEDEMVCRVTPRGKNFTKVVIESNVQSAAMITAIYKELEGLEMSVMQF